LPELPDPDVAFRELWIHFARPDSWRCFADAAPALKALREAGLAVCIASNFDNRLRGVLTGLPDLSGWIDHLLISSEVGYRKPHPAFFQAACRSLGCPPAHVLCVGDDPDNDVRGAIGAGLQGVLIDRLGRRYGDLPAVADLLALVSALPEEMRLGFSPLRKVRVEGR
jgi:putative hydrolase of the HAD superfamily